MDDSKLAPKPAPALVPSRTALVSTIDDEPTQPFPGSFTGTINDDGRVELKLERLPFEITAIDTQDQLFKAVSVRYEAYARHLPELARHLAAPEPQDTEPGYTVLLAESRLDRSALATMRLQTNEYGPLALEHSIDLPSWLRNRPLVEATRLAVASNVRGRFVTLVMFKAFFQFCLERDIEWMVICARAPLDRMYESLLFRDVLPGGEYVPLRHSAGIPHRPLAFNVRTAEARWRTRGHPLYSFMALTEHPDIRVGIPGSTVVPLPVYYRDRAAAS